MHGPNAPARYYSLVSHFDFNTIELIFMYGQNDIIMIWRKCIPALLILAAICFNCKSDYENEVEKCKELIQSLKAEKLPFYDRLYYQIIPNKATPNLQVLQADSLYRTTKKITNIIDSLILVIEKMDSSGENREIGQYVLVTSSIGLTLTMGANSIYKYCSELITDETKKRIVKQHFLKYNGLLGSLEFNEIYFSKSSTSFIVMTLLGLKQDLIKATYLGLVDLNEIQKIPTRI